MNKKKVVIATLCTMAALGCGTLLIWRNLTYQHGGWPYDPGAFGYTAKQK